MSIDNSAAPVKKLDPLNTLMGVRAVSVEPGDLAFAQAVGERFHDHRGKTVLGSIGVMIDGAMGGAVYSGLTSGHQSVLAQVTVSAGADIPDVADVGATGTLVHLDDGVGLASGQLRDENGTLLAVMAGRAMVVSRPPVVGIDDYVEGEPLPVPTPEKTSNLSGLSGSDVVEGIRDGKLERGPLAGLLDLAFVDVTPGSVVGEFAPVAWMANRWAPFRAVSSSRSRRHHWPVCPDPDPRRPGLSRPRPQDRLPALTRHRRAGLARRGLRDSCRAQARADRNSHRRRRRTGLCAGHFEHSDALPASSQRITSSAPGRPSTIETTAHTMEVQRREQRHRSEQAAREPSAGSRPRRNHQSRRAHRSVLRQQWHRHDDFGCGCVDDNHFRHFRRGHVR